MTKKLSKQARRKELTGTNLAATKKREAKLRTQIKLLTGITECQSLRISDLDKRLKELESAIAGVGQLFWKFQQAIAAHCQPETKPLAKLTYGVPKGKK